MKKCCIGSVLLILGCSQAKYSMEPMALHRAVEMYPSMEEIPIDSIENRDTYVDYGIQPFVETAKDARSTFSIDVDTAL